MVESTSWAQIAQSEQNRARGGNINNLRLISGNNYNVRFVGDPVKFEKYFINNKSAITDGAEKCIIRSKFNVEPNTRYAVRVIDRADGKLKVLEIAPSVLKPVIAWWKARKNDPGGDNGCDFNIDITGQKKNTRYNVTPLDITPFTSEEKSMIASEPLDLRKLYKPTPQSEIEALLYENAPPSGAVRTSPGAVAQSSGSAKPAGWSEPPF